MNTTTKKCTRPQYACTNEKLKLIGSIDGYFPDFGHHLENEMGGLWLYPIKVLDGFWMHFIDHTAKTVSCYMQADEFKNFPHKNEFYYNHGLGHTTVVAKRTQIAPEGSLGVVVTYEFKNEGKEACECSTAFMARVNLRPLWLAEEINVFDGTEDEIKYFENENMFVAKDNSNPWYAALSCSVAPDDTRMGQFFGPENTTGNGVSCEYTHHFTLQPGEGKTLKFYIAGSFSKEEEAVSECKMLQQEKNYEQEKVKKYEDLYKVANLEIEDKNFENIYKWVKVNTDWLILDIEEYGRGIIAGLPEYPWWFGCDSFYTLQGVLCMGDYKLCRDTLSLIHDYSVKYNGNGRIVHEILPNGHCPNYGNTQETAHFVTMVWKYYEWTKDQSLLDETLPYIKKCIAWLQEQDDDNDYFPSGYGIIEIAGLNMEMIDTAVYTCEAYDCYSKICTLYGEDEESKKFKNLFEASKEQINKELWDDRAGLYCDAFASYETIKKKKDVIDGMLKEAKCDHVRDYMKLLLEERRDDGNQERGWLLNRNWVINTPMEIGIAPIDKANRALEIMSTDEFIGEYGMYLNSLSQSATMTISTGVMAVSQAMYRRSDEALRLIKKIFKTFGMATPGSISEMSPDYGCFTQAWTTYSVMLPIIRFFFGICPSAVEKKIYLNPCMPSEWTKASLGDVKVLDGSISISYERVGNQVKLNIKNNTEYPIILQGCNNILVNGQEFNEKEISQSEVEIVYDIKESSK